VRIIAGACAISAGSTLILVAVFGEVAHPMLPDNLAPIVLALVGIGSLRAGWWCWHD
jgi:hypothetical protein